MDSNVIAIIDKLGDEQFIPTLDKQMIFDRYRSLHNSELKLHRIDDGGKLKYLISSLEDSEKQLCVSKNILCISSNYRTD